jgi:hypothetical protein
MMEGRARGVLIISRGTDEHDDALALELSRRRISFWRWNLEMFPRASPLSIRLSPDRDGTIGGTLRTADCDLELEDVKSVWLRRRLSELFARQDPADAVAAFVRLELEAALRSVADVLRGAFWVNAPQALHAMTPTIRQVQAASAAGLLVPRTLVTTDTARARDFSDSLGGRVVATSFGGPLPASVFQEEIPYQADVHALIVGQHVFAAERHSTTAEYRPCALPASTVAACRHLLRELGLVSGAVCMIRRPDGEHVFLAVTANVEWLWLERVTGQAITSAFADLLDGGSANDNL